MIDIKSDGHAIVAYAFGLRNFNQESLESLNVLFDHPTLLQRKLSTLIFNYLRDQHVNNAKIQ